MFTSLGKERKKTRRKEGRAKEPGEGGTKRGRAARKTGCRSPFKCVSPMTFY